jgi:transcriptional regulator with XRE-family HTH domain
MPCCRYERPTIGRLWHFATMVTPGQCRAARGLLGWNQQELARRARVGIVTVHELETGVSQPRRATLDVIRRAFRRVRHLRHQFLSDKLSDPQTQANVRSNPEVLRGGLLRQEAKRLDAMYRYERRALSRRKFAIRVLDAERAVTLQEYNPMWSFLAERSQKHQ